MYPKSSGAKGTEQAQDLQLGLVMEEHCWLPCLSHITENIELFGLWVVWLIIQWCYTMLSFQSSFGTHFFKLQVVLCSARDLGFNSSHGEPFMLERPFDWRVTFAALGEASDVPLLRVESPSMLSCQDVTSPLLQGFHKHSLWQGQASEFWSRFKTRQRWWEFGCCFIVTTPIQSHWLGSWDGICLLQKLCFSHFAKFCFLDLLHRQNWCNRECNEALLIVFARDSENFWRRSSCFPEMWVRIKLCSSLWPCLGCDLWRGLSCLSRGMLFFLPWAEIPALAVVAAALLPSFLGEHSSHLLLKQNQPWAEQSQRRSQCFFQAELDELLKHKDAGFCSC